MRTRNTETTTPKSSLPPKKTLTKKTPIKTPPKPSEPSTTPKSAPSTGAAAAKQKAGGVAAAKQVTPKAAAAAATPKLEPKVEEASTSVVAAEVTLEVKPAPVVKTAVKKTPGKTTKAAASAAKTAVSKTPEPVVAVKIEVEPIVETIKSPTAVKTASSKTTKLVKIVKRKVVQPRKSDESSVNKAASSVNKAASSKTLKSPKKEEPVVTMVNSEELSVSKVVDSPKEDESSVSKAVESPKKDEPNVVNVKESPRKELVVSKVVETPMEEEAETGVKMEDEEVNEQADEDPEGVYETNEPESNLVNMEEHSKEVEVGKELVSDEEDHNADEGMVDYGEQEGFEEPGDEEFADDEVVEPDERAGGEEVEQLEISAIAKERKIKKELEVFVGGLDRDAVEDDVKKAFDSIGEIVEVRLHKNPQTNKNKGFAFVKFANKEQASKALAEMKNPVIRGKRCGVAPSEDNDTLFVGNICNTWTKEAIKQKMKEYGVEGVENVTLVPDAQHEGLSRGFAFVEFSCHADAMLAYKRLQKPDVVFGHTERTAKVAFAEPLREPDPEIMAQVKSVFVDGLPPHWDEEHVREHFKVYGDIERIVLARNMPTAKRKDFGFVDFTTHGAAVACIDGVNNTELGDGKSKTKVKVRLASPLPKTQAVKGGLCGGFRIGHANSGTSSRFGRGFGRGGRSFNRGNFQHNKGFHARGRGQRGRFDYAGHDDFETPYYEFPERRSFGGRGGRRDYGPYGEEFASQAATSSRPDLGWHRRGAVERGRGRSVQSRRQPFSPEGHYSRPFGGRHFVDDPYTYNDSGHGIKRPYSMMDHEPGYLEPSRLRPRFDYSDPVVSSSGSRYQGSFGSSSGLYSHDYYGSDYGGSSYSSMYGGGDRSYGGGYYY